MDDIAFLRQADTEIILALSNGNEGVIDFNRRFTQALEAVQNLSIDQRPDSAQIKRIIRNVRDTVAYLLEFEDKDQQKMRWVHSKTTLTIRDWVRSKAIQAIREEGAAVAATDIQANLTPATDSQANITPATDIEANPISSKFFNTKILRDWFVDNLDNPFPDTKTKDDLVAETNALPGDGAGGRASKPMHTIQLRNWFSDMRLRSGWASFKKTYARNNWVAFQSLIDTLRRQGQAPPAGVMDDVAELMSAWNVTMMVEKDEVDDDDEEGQNQQGRAKTGSKGKEASASRSNQSTANPRSSVNPATADPTGAIRAKACRDAYSKMMGHIAAKYTEEGAAVAATDIQANLTPATDSQANITPATDIEANPISSKVFNTKILRDWFVDNLAMMSKDLRRFNNLVPVQPLQRSVVQ